MTVDPPARVPRATHAGPWPAILGLAALLPGVALAQDGQDPSPGARVINGYDADIDLVRPMFTPEILPGIDVPQKSRAGTVRWGLVGQYTLNPLVQYEFEQEVGSVVTHRASAWLGASADITPALTARLVLPMHLQFGSTVPRYASDGFAFGDMNLGVHYAFYTSPSVSLGARLDLSLPTSRRQFYAGERLPRAHPAFLMMVDAGRVRWALDLGANVRFSDVVTTEEWTLGQELAANTGVRVNVIRETLDLGVALYSRFGFANFFGAAESSGEALLTGRYQATKAVAVQLSAGRGFTLGYGSSDVRAMLGLEFRRVPPYKPQPGDPDYVDPNAVEEGGGLQFDVRSIEGVDVTRPGDLPEEPDFKEGELAKIDLEAKEIRIAQDIQFTVGTSKIIPESLPILDYIAALLNADARIGHVVIEGHASEDGEYLPNYALSRDRAVTIWDRLVEKGVHPSRLSYRGMGEVLPADGTERTGDLQASRRVEFKIVRQYSELEPTPSYRLDMQFPWNGEFYEAVQPTRPLPGEDAQLPAEFRRRPEAEAEDAFQDVTFDTPDEGEDDAFEFEGEPEDSAEDPWETDAPEGTGPDEDTPDDTPNDGEAE